jgi:tRNA modification GTPase
MEYLQEHLARAMGYQPAQAGLISARRRHLEEARIRLVEQGAAELMAEELRLGQQRLGEITGEVSSDDLLGRIFSSFCIGK